MLLPSRMAPSAVMPTTRPTSAIKLMKGACQLGSRQCDRQGASRSCIATKDLPEAGRPLTIHHVYGRRSEIGLPWYARDADRATLEP